MAIGIARRQFISVLGDATVAWPLAAHAQWPALPVIGFMSAGTTQVAASQIPAFRQGLADTGFVEGRNVAIEYRIAEGHLERLPEFAVGLGARQGLPLLGSRRAARGDRLCLRKSATTLAIARSSL